jgi:hypothetical protein
MNLDSLSGPLATAFVAASLIGWALAFPDLLLKRHLGVLSTLAWGLILLVPVFGALVYYALRPSFRPSPIEHADQFVEQQLAVVADLRRRGLVTPEEYERERRALVERTSLQLALKDF